jgi:hypothetical protein
MAEITVTEAVRLLADEAERLGADANDNKGIVRELVTAHGLSFNAWFCVCCELADRSAQREGYWNQGERAASRMKISTGPAKLTLDNSPIVENNDHVR